MCLCVCVDWYSCSRINEVQVRVSIGFYSHVFLDCKIMLCSRVMPSFTLGMPLQPFQEHVAKLVYQVLLLYLKLALQ